MTGATGRVGYRVLEALADQGAEATAMVRVEAKGLDLPGAAKHVVASFDEPPPSEVLQDFEKVFLLSPAQEEQAELEIRFIDALVAAGHLPHVVKIAADGFQDPDCDVRFMRNHREIAVHLGATGLPATYLAPSPYMESLLSSAQSVREEATIYAPAAHAKVSFVSAGDVAAIAAYALTSADAADNTYVVTGPEALTYSDVAARISQVYGRQVAYSSVAERRARQQFQASGMTPWQVDGALELFDWIRHGGTDEVTTDVREVTGSDPMPLDEWLGEMRVAFLGPPPDLPTDVF
ncbi:MAG TPA: NmrA family NAD(P)-binding protein [Streptosporangiaceae bacterium]|nr:NmrA family NAD(P)-binding protein [Streptosporangiaceae bacterium]